MTIAKTQNGDSLTLSLSGRLDTTTAPQLQEALLPALDAAGAVELDFTELSYVSSAGLRVLLMGEKTAKAKAVTMTLTHVSADVMEVFTMTGFDGILQLA